MILGAYVPSQGGKMNKLFDYARITVLLLGLLIGIQLPGLVDEYGRLLLARVQESNISVSQFQDDAERFFDGDISRLITYYESQQDLVIVAGGESIRAIVERNLYLSDALNNFRQSPVNAYFQAFIAPLPEIRDQIRDSYRYTVTLNTAAVGSGVGLALLAMMLFELLIFCLRKCSTLFSRKSKTSPVRN